MMNRAQYESKADYGTKPQRGNYLQDPLAQAMDEEELRRKARVDFERLKWQFYQTQMQAIRSDIDFITQGKPQKYRPSKHHHDNLESIIQGSAKEASPSVEQAYQFFKQSELGHLLQQKYGDVEFDMYAIQDLPDGLHAYVQHSSDGHKSIVLNSNYAKALEDFAQGNYTAQVKDLMLSFAHEYIHGVDDPKYNWGPKPETNTWEATARLFGEASLYTKDNEMKQFYVTAAEESYKIADGLVRNGEESYGGLEQATSAHYEGVSGSGPGYSLPSGGSSLGGHGLEGSALGQYVN